MSMMPAPKARTVHASDASPDDGVVRLVEVYSRADEEWHLTVEVDLTAGPTLAVTIAGRYLHPPLAPADYVIEDTVAAMRSKIAAAGLDVAAEDELADAVEELLDDTRRIWAVCGDNVDGCPAAHYYALGGHMETTLGGHLIPTIWHETAAVTAYNDVGVADDVVISWWERPS